MHKASLDTILRYLKDESSTEWGQIMFTQCLILVNEIIKEYTKKIETHKQELIEMMNKYYDSKYATNDALEFFETIMSQIIQNEKILTTYKNLYDQYNKDKHGL